MVVWIFARHFLKNYYKVKILYHRYLLNIKRIESVKKIGLSEKFGATATTEIGATVIFNRFISFFGYQRKLTPQNYFFSSPFFPFWFVAFFSIKKRLEMNL